MFKAQLRNTQIHFLLYLGLGFLAARVFLSSKEASLRLLLAVFLVCMLYALSDEFHQEFVTGRGWELIDLVADAVGILVGISLKLKADLTHFVRGRSSI